MAATLRSAACTLACLAALAAADRWSDTAPLLNPDAEGHAVLLRDGSVLRVAGHGACELYVPSVGRWFPIAALQQPRTGFAVARLNDGRVLAIGGTSPADPDIALASCELYDPATRAWRATGSLRTARRSHTADTLLDGRVLVAGGTGRTAAVDDPATPYPDDEYPGGWFLGRLPLAEVYDAATGRWSTTGSLAVAHTGAVSVRLADGRVLLYGGWSDAGERAFQQPIGEVFDPRANRWTRTANDPYDDAFSTQPLTLLRDGRVLLPNGVHPFGFRAEAARLYDPPSNRWLPAPALEAIDPRVVQLADGRVLAAGGLVDDGFAPMPTTLAQTWNRGSAGWIAAAPLRHARAQPQLVRLPDARVLAIGGDDRGTCELFQPAASGILAPGIALFRPLTAIN